MTKKLLSMILTIFLIVTMSISMVGCDKSDNTNNGKNAVCILLGAHSNTKGLNLSSEVIQDTVVSAVESYGFVSVVNVDGSPELVCGGSYDMPDSYKNNASPTKQKRENEQKAKSLLRDLSNINANDEEVDLLEALNIGIRSFASLPSGDFNKTIIIIDNGLQTTGILNFQNNLMSCQPEYIVKILKEKEAIPNLNNIHVIFEHLGDVASPQKPLSSAQKNHLTDIWKSIIEAGGGTVEFVDTIPNNNDLGEGLPKVTPIDLPTETPVKLEETVCVDEKFETSFIAEDQVAFEPGTANFIDKEKATKTISGVSEYMSSHKDFELLIVGTTASDFDSDENRELSLQRADAVKRILTDEYDIKDSRISTLGLGSADPWHISGLGNGDAGSVNRKVVLLDLNSEEAKRILS